MPRTTGGAAAGALEAKDRAAIKKRERVSNDVTIPKIGLLPDSQFPEPPGRRLIPWSQQNASGTDIIVGCCNEKGVFEGLMLTDVQMQVLLRYFTMASTYMPRDAPPQLNGLAASLRNGMATLVVTRRAFGRDMDEGNGPERNAAQPLFWEEVQQARIMNPSLRITCIDAPANITGAQLSKVLTQPLSDHRELAFYEGIWYTPEFKSNQAISKQVKEMKASQKPLWHTRVAALGSAPGNNYRDTVEIKKAGEIFNRKRFAWRELEEKAVYKSWKPVFTDENYVRPVPPKIERDFTGPTVHQRESSPIGELMDHSAEGQE